MHKTSNTTTTTTGKVSKNRSVNTDSDNGDESDDEATSGVNDKLATASGQKRQKQQKTYAPELLPMKSCDDSSKSMITLSNYLMKKRKWPYRGWHKRFFVLQNGYLMYGKSEQEIKRGRYSGKCDIGLCIVTYIRELHRINIDETNSVYHIKIKDKNTFEQWLEQITIHRHNRQKILEEQSPLIKNSINTDESKKETNDKSSLPTNNIIQSSDRLFYNDFADIQVQLSSLSDILEQIKINTATTSSISSRSIDGGKTSSGHTPSASISSINSFTLLDTQRQDYFEISKKVFDNLNNLYKRLSVLAIEQQQQLINPVNVGTSNTLQSVSSTSTTLSRHESIFYDAPDAISVLLLNEDKDEIEKMSDFDSSSCGDDESHAGDLSPISAIPPQLKLPEIKWRRSSLPSYAPDTSNIGLWNIMRKAIGKDLSRVAMPVILNEPLGLLQKLCEEMEYSDLLDRASQTDDVYLRLVYIVAFIVSTYSSNYYRTGRKNFNPLLGETYECIREDKGWKFLAEQVSHHPPISVCTCISPNFIFSQKLQATVKFWGKSMEILPDSLNRLILPKYNEIITWNKCTMCIHNVLSPERWIDHYGDVIVESSFGIKARISFIQSDYRTRLNNVAGDIVDATGKVVHKIFGHWHENVFCGNDQTAKCIWRQSAVPENSKQYYGFTRFAIELNELDDDLRKQLPPTDTRFRPDQRLFEAGQIEQSEKEKARIEQAQRKRAAVDPSPKWFKRDGDLFALIRDEDSQNNYWKKREENWTDVEFIELW
ncbi:unnamed protein product [Rotaria sordida]|uniref:PH domain-containing protein n=1 Tax=Rotaria sordida TaxID=392033 RepID=A0A815JHE5_9BILA|nr:unnamed protein product [Rotaria sordida]CAF1381069.1 unnamed protein product [Rotaria sordida]